MSKIHYFQRYATLENTVTNNTLLLFARIAGYSTAKISALLNTLTGEPVDVGIEIKQQTRDKDGVPDGMIFQSSFKIAIESKMDAAPDIKQLRRHADSLSTTGAEQKILLLLTKTPWDQAAKFSEELAEVIFRNVTYEDICKAVEPLFEPHEADMRDLVEDYLAYCNDVELFDQSRFLMRIVPCGKTWEIARQHGIYFAPSDRGYTKHRFVGLYTDKKVQTLWEIDSIFDVDYDKNTKRIKTKTCIQGKDSKDYVDKIVGIIKDAETQYHDIAHGHRFFCGTPVETDYQKSSPGGIFGPRFVNLQDVIGDFKDASDVARKLKGKKWE